MSNITFVIPRHNDFNYERFIQASIKKYDDFNELLIVNDEGKCENIFVKYQKAVDVIKEKKLPDDDIIVFVHEDVGIVDECFREKLELLFSKRTDVGLVGIVGTTELTESGAWWTNTPDKLKGHLVQGNDKDTVGKGFYLKKGSVGFHDNIVAIDGCMMATTAKIVKEIINFDLQTFSESNDFYDLDLCIQILESGYKVAVADILIYHQSTGKGSLGKSWQDAKDKFINKYRSKGYKFPMTIYDFYKQDKNDSDIVEIEI